MASVDTVLYLDAVAHGAFMFMACQQTFVLYRRQFRNGVSDWQKSLYRVGSFMMFVLFLQVVYGVVIDALQLKPDGTTANTLLLTDLLVIPAVAILLRTLTHHVSLDWKTILCYYAPFVLAPVINQLTGSPLVIKLAMVGYLVFALLVIVSSFVYIKRFHKGLLHSYADVEGRDLRWFYAIICFFVVAFVFWLVLYFYFKSPISKMVYLFLSCFLWYFVSRRIAMQRDARLAHEVQKEEPEPDAAHPFAAERRNLRLRVDREIDQLCKEQKIFQTPDLDLLYLSEALDVDKQVVKSCFDARKTTFYEYINGLRLEYAAQLLLSSSCEVEEVALQSGFSAEYVFAREFYARYECSPAQYRILMNKA